MDRLFPPKPLLLDGNPVENWKRWMKDFVFFMTAAEYTKKADNVKASLLLHCIGEKARDVYDTLPFDAEADKLSYEKIVEKFDAYFAPRKNITFSRFKFFTYRQETGQSFNTYLTEMKKLCCDSELGALQTDLLRDMLIIGLHDRRLQEALLRESDLTLTKTISTCQNAELTHKQAKTMQQPSSYDVNAVGKKFSSRYEKGSHKNVHGGNPGRSNV